jgi:hypothetical protein
MEMDPDMYGGGEPGREQVKNYLLAEGFRRSVGKSNVIHLSMRYSAQSERLYRRAIADFDRIKALSSGAGPLACVLEASEPLPDQTNPIPPEPTRTEPLTPSEPAPETPPAAAPQTPETPKVDSGNPCNPCNPPVRSNSAHYSTCVCPKCLAEKAEKAALSQTTELP